MDRSDRNRRVPPKKGAPEGPHKQVPSPAQEETRAKIWRLQARLRRLKGSGREDKTKQQRLEEDLRKARAKLRRLLNEAERQRRRRERLRSGESQDHNESVMATLKSCTRFQDLVHELNVLGFAVGQTDDRTQESEPLSEVDGVKVEMELIEGDEELINTGIKMEPHDSSPSPLPPLLDAHYETTHSTEDVSYRLWYERQAEVHRQWEERMFKEQMELAKSMLQSVTATFVQGIQQVVDTLTSARNFSSFPTNGMEPS